MMSNTLVTDSFKNTKRVSRVSQKPQTGSHNLDKTIVYNKDIEILKSFDLNLEYGPCTGITRMERWTRAEKHGLNPPKVIQAIILQNSNDTEYTHSLWKDYQI